MSEKLSLKQKVLAILAILGLVGGGGAVMLGSSQIINVKNSAPATTTPITLTAVGVATSTMTISDERTTKLGFDVIVNASTSLQSLDVFPELEWKHEFGTAAGRGDLFEDLFIHSDDLTITATTSLLSQSGKTYRWHPSSSTTKGTVIEYSADGLSTTTSWYFRIPDIDVLGRRVKTIFSNPSTTTPFDIWYSAIMEQEVR